MENKFKKTLARIAAILSIVAVFSFNLSYAASANINDLGNAGSAQMANITDQELEDWLNSDENKSAEDEQEGTGSKSYQVITSKMVEQAKQLSPELAKKIDDLYQAQEKLREALSSKNNIQNAHAEYKAMHKEAKELVNEISIASNSENKAKAEANLSSFITKYPEMEKPAIQLELSAYAKSLNGIMIIHKAKKFCDNNCTPLEKAKAIIATIADNNIGTILIQKEKFDFVTPALKKTSEPAVIELIKSLDNKYTTPTAQPSSNSNNEPKKPTSPPTNQSSSNQDDQYDPYKSGWGQKKQPTSDINDEPTNPNNSKNTKKKKSDSKEEPSAITTPANTTSTNNDHKKILYKKHHPIHHNNIIDSNATKAVEPIVHPIDQLDKNIGIRSIFFSNQALSE